MCPFVALGIVATLFDSSYVFSRMIGHMQKAVEMVKYLFLLAPKGQNMLLSKKRDHSGARTLHFTSLGVKFYTINK